MIVRLFAAFLAYFCPGVQNAAPSFQADVEAFIQEEVEPLSRRQLVAYQFGKPLHLDVNRGTTYTASRYVRLPLPYAPLQEGVAPPGEPISTIREIRSGRSLAICSAMRPPRELRTIAVFSMPRASRNAHTWSVQARSE